MTDDDYSDIDNEKTYIMSSLDKLPWHKKIELQLYICIRNRDKYGIYHNEVLKLEDCINDNFYGVDFKTPIKENIEKLEQERKEVRQKWIKECDNGMYYHPRSFHDLTFENKDKLKKKEYFWYWHRRFEVIRTQLAAKRGLLWGKRSLPGGKQMDMPDD